MELYVCRIAAFAPCLREGTALLPEERRERLARLRDPDAQLRCLCGGLLLRHFVGEVELAPGGKPFSRSGPCFSLTHSGPLAALALSPQPVGLDLEKPRAVRPLVAQHCFLPEEQAWMAEDPEPRFLFLWTRKEAVMKGCGRGLSLPARSFSVLPGARPQAEGLTFSLYTTRFEGCTLSSAASRGEEPRFQPVIVEPETLLQ